MPSQPPLLKLPDWFRVDGKSIRIGEPSLFPTADQENMLVGNGIMGYRLWKRQAENH